MTSGVAPEQAGTVQNLSNDELWELLRAVSETLAYSEAAVVDEFDGFTPDEIDRVRNLIATAKQAAGFLDRILLDMMRDHLGEKGFVRYGPTVYRAGRDKSWKLKREHENEFWRWVNSDRRLARELFNPNQARTTGLKALAGAMSDGGWANPDTGELGWQAFEDYFLDVTDKGPVVQVLPADRAPQFIANTPSGEVVRK